MEERRGEAFAGTEQLTVVGRQLHAGDPAPDFRLDYLDLADMAVSTVGLADSAGLVRLLSVVNSLQRPVCQLVTRQWEALSADLPPEVCIYTVSMDSPQMQARWQDTAGVLHQALSAHRDEQFGQDYGGWLKEWYLLQRAVFVIDRNDRIVYVEYVADQLREPDYSAALQVVRQATGVKANVLLTHFGNLKWTHPHGSERESVFGHSERATARICSAMAAQRVPSEEPGIKVAPLLFALLTPGSSDGVKNAPIAFAKKTTSCFFAQEE